MTDTDGDGRLDDTCPATVELRAAAEAGDADLVATCLAQNVVLRSPITDRVVFRGRDQARAVLREVFAVLRDVHYTVDVGDQRTRALFYTAAVGGRRLEEGMRLHLDEQGRIEELTIFYRPLPGLTAFAADLAPRIAHHHSRGRARLARLVMRPLAVITALGDRLAPWLAGPTAE